MDDEQFLSLNLPMPDLAIFDAQPDAISIQHFRGAAITLDPRVSHVSVTREKPPVERMVDDWGAICEVFKESVTYYAAISGVTLAAGDELRLVYTHVTGASTLVTLTVLEPEGSRARIAAPVIRRGAGGNW